ncbi:MAG: hypothetical protein H0U28_01515, partial [Nocardioidaceae bacterium]|nr:hypothetical protein [Nocardioidaceae bacterium]
MSTTSPSTDPPVRSGLPHEATPWVHVAAAVAGLTALLALILTGFAWPASNLAPRDLPIAVAGPPPAVAPVEQQLTAAGDDAFDVTAAASRKAAVAAIEDRDVYGAIVIGETASELLTAPAASPVVAQLLVELSAQLAAAAPAGTPPPVVTEVVPLPADDPRGAGLAAG